MIYIFIKTDDIYTNKGRYNSKLELGEHMLEVTKEQYDTIEFPCKLIDGKFIKCEMPIINETITASEFEQLQADVDMIKIEMGLF